MSYITVNYSIFMYLFLREQIKPTTYGICPKVSNVYGNQLTICVDHLFHIYFYERKSDEIMVELLEDSFV